MSERREYRLTLSVISPFLFQGVTNTRLGVDAAFLRDEEGRPIIPAAQARGVLRAAIEAMMAHRYSGVSAEELFGKASVDGGNAAGELDAPERGALLFSDLVGPAPDHGLEMTRIAINDETGAVDRGMLQVIELAAPPGKACSFSGTVLLRLPDPGKSDSVEAALKKAVKLIPAIGAIKSAGFGAIEPAGCAFEKISRSPLAPKTGATPQNDRPMVFDVSFDRPILVDSKRVTDNMFSGSTIVPGAAFKGAVAVRLQLAGNKTDQEPLRSALASVRFSHAFPLVGTVRADRALPMSVVTDGDEKSPRFSDISSWSFGDAPRFDDYTVADFLVTAKKDVKSKARALMHLPDTSGSPELEGGASKSGIRRFARTHIKIDGDTLVADDQNLYSTEVVGTMDRMWRLTVDFGAVADPAMAALIAGAIGGRIDGIGRTGATATLTQTGDAPLPTVSGNGATLVLETPALLFDGAIADLAMRKRYEDYFHTRLGGAKLVNFFARRRMAGGYQATRHRAYGGAYYPFVLTEPGSVFRLDLPDQKARDAVNKALRFGLPAANLDGKAVDWRNCPYLPQNGYGEVSLGVAGGLTDAGVKKVRAPDVR